jgi:hypothetical protein
VTKQQAIRKLAEYGYQFLRNDGKFCVYFSKDGRELLADPRELLAEVELDRALKSK